MGDPVFVSACDIGMCTGCEPVMYVQLSSDPSPAGRGVLDAAVFIGLLMCCAVYLVNQVAMQYPQ
jgi:hypothetical protein